MEALFLKLVNMSITASWLVLAVLLLRLVFRQAPKWMLCSLWGLVALRLICPFSIESALSLIPSSQPLPQEIIYTATPVIDSGIPPIDNAINPVLSQSMAPALGASANPTQIWSCILSQVWLLGMAVMLLYALVSFFLLKRRMATATLLRDNIKQSERVESPFVLGLFRPTIYLPYAIEDGDMAHVIAHEQAHIHRRDHWWKPLGFLLLAVYWFNPLLWLAYVLLCRDIEAACDEKVIREMEKDDRRAYSTALLHCSIHRRRIAACPLAFGEVGVKERVTRVMNYKKPAFWIVFAAVAASTVVAVCFLTNPKGVSLDDITAQRGYTVLEQKQVEFSLSVPKDALPEQIYTHEGYEFDENEVIAYQTDTTTIYLRKAMISNESDELLYFTFDFSYELPFFGTVIDPYHYNDNDTASYTLWLRSKTLRDKNQVYPDAVHLRAQGPNRQVAFYVSVDACKAANESLIIDVCGNQVTYAKNGLEEVAREKLEKMEIPEMMAEKIEMLTEPPSFEPTVLTSDEIAQVNRAFDHYVYDETGRAIGVKAISCFFTSYYDDVRELNFEKFMRYFPSDGLTADQQEFEALREVEGWPFASVAALEQMVVPVHKYPAETVEQVLQKYATISLGDLDTSGVAHLEKYQAYYNYTSDAGSGRFVCTRGEKEGDMVRLYEEDGYGTDVLTLKYVDGAYRIVSHQRFNP